MKKVAILFVVLAIATHSNAGNWKAKGFIEPTKNIDWVMYSISFLLKGERGDRKLKKAAVREFSPANRSTVLCVNIAGSYSGFSCVDTGRIVRIAKDAPDIVPNTMNYLGTDDAFNMDVHRLIEFKPYSSDDVDCSILIIDVPQLACY